MPIMKNLKSLLLGVLFITVVADVSAQLLLDENFSYGSTTDTLTNPAIGGINWKRHSGTGGPLSYITSSLSYTGYPSSGAGGAIAFAHASTSREDANRAFSNSVNTGSVFVSFLLSVTASGGTTGDYAVHLNDTNGNSLPGNVFKGRLFLKDGSTAGTFKLGLSKGGTATVATFTSTDYPVNTTVIVVMKYVFNTATTTDDSVYATVINTTIPSSEPTYLLAATDVSSTDLTRAKSLCIRQGTVGTGSATIDGVRVASSWSDLMGFGSTSPAPVTGLSVTGLTKNSARITFTKNGSYNPSKMKVLVFMKKDSAIIQGLPNKAVNGYIANTNIALGGTAYQHDAAAFCVLNADTGGVVVSGMVSGSIYHLLAYVVSTDDSIYSPASVTSGSASLLPAPVSNLSFTTVGQTSAILKWVKPATFDYTQSQVLVFAKEGSAISAVPTLARASVYAATSQFNNASQSIGSDSMAKCVYNGTLDSVFIVGLLPGANYHFAVFVGRNADSTYSSGVTTNGTTDSLKAAPSPVTSLSFTNTTHNVFVVNWVKPPAYVDSSMTTLVFIKAASPIQTGVNSLPSYAYTPNVIFGGGSVFQHDSSAYCLYKGDSMRINALNLSPLTTYYVSIYVVRDSDTSYSLATNGSRATGETPPSAAFNGGITGTSQTTARISWSKQTDYVNARFTTLVFLKEGVIAAGPLLKAAIRYTPSSLFPTGARFDADSQAYCVFRGDTNFVNISGLKSNTTYQAIIVVMRDADSVQSFGAFATGSTMGPPLHYAIGQINKVNSLTGVADSVGKFAALTGVVYGFNQRFTGIQFVLRDSTGGISVVNTTKNFGYTVNEGDIVQVSGAISTNRGLTQLVTDTIILVSSGATLNTPLVVNKPDESTESNLIRINNVKFVTRPNGANWPTISTNITVTNQTNDTFIIRIVNSSTLAGKPLPSTPTFNVTGLGSQQSTSFSSPFAFNGYQILPRTQDDVTLNLPDSLSPFDLISPAEGDTILLTNTNLNDTVLLSWTPSVNSNGVDPTNYTFVLDTVGQDFSTPRFELVTGTLSTLPLTKANIYAMATTNGIALGQLFSGIWQAKAESNTLVRYSTSIRNIFIINNVTTGTTELTRLNAIQLYPNPATKQTAIYGLIPHKDVVSIWGITGKLEYSATAAQATEKLPIDALAAGVYFVRIQSGAAITVRKLLIP